MKITRTDANLNTRGHHPRVYRLPVEIDGAVTFIEVEAWAYELTPNGRGEGNHYEPQFFSHQVSPEALQAIVSAHIQSHEPQNGEQHDCNRYPSAADHDHPAAATA